MCARAQALGDGVRAVCPTGPTTFLQETILGRVVVLNLAHEVTREPWAFMETNSLLLSIYETHLMAPWGLQNLGWKIAPPPNRITPEPRS